MNSAEYKLFGGPLIQKKDLMKMASPVTHASKDDAPLLIGHGSEDVVVPLDQAKRMYEAMKAAGATAYYAPVMGGTHGTLGSEFYRRRTDFFRKYLLDEKVEISNEPITLPKLAAEGDKRAAEPVKEEFEPASNSAIWPAPDSAPASASTPASLTVTRCVRCASLTT